MSKAQFTVKKYVIPLARKEDKGINPKEVDTKELVNAMINDYSEIYKYEKGNK